MFVHVNWKICIIFVPIIQNSNRMTKNIRILDIALKAGVSIGTVDRVLHQRGEVSVETRDKILKIIRDFDYRPNILASSLASKKIITIASFTPRASSKDSFWSKPQEGIEKAVSKLTQYGIRLQSHHFKMEDPESFTREANKLLETSPDGILLAPWGKRESLKFTQILDQRSIPYVFIDSNLTEANPISFIVQDSVQSGFLAAKLLDYGIAPKSNILLIHITKDLQNANHLLLRESGFLNYFETVSHKLHRIIKMEVSADEIETAKGINTSIAKVNSIDAVFVTNSKVHLVAGLFDTYEIRPKIIGYDLIQKNAELLLKGKIDFLLNQNPEKQGFTAINLLFDQLVRKEKVNKSNYMAIDILTKENFKYYVSL